MASTIKLTSELASRTAHDVTQSAESWKRYLDTAARLHVVGVPAGPARAGELLGYH